MNTKAAHLASFTHSLTHSHAKTHSERLLTLILAVRTQGGNDYRMTTAIVDILMKSKQGMELSDAEVAADQPRQHTDAEGIIGKLPLQVWDLEKAGQDHLAISMVLILLAVPTQKTRNEKN